MDQFYRGDGEFRSKAAPASRLRAIHALLVPSISIAMMSPALGQSQNPQSIPRAHAIIDGKDIQPRAPAGDPSNPDPMAADLLREDRSINRRVVTPHDFFGHPFDGAAETAPPGPARTER